MEARRRQPSHSASVYSEDNNKGHRRHDSQSATPAGDEDADGSSKRSTRGRNPLPPTVGPLFPPLPPKQPKPRANSNRMSVKPSIPDDIESSESKPDVSIANNGLNALASPPGNKRDLLSGSVTSLTPPPTSEDALDQEDSGQGEASSSKDTNLAADEHDHHSHHTHSPIREADSERKAEEQNEQAESTPENGRNGRKIAREAETPQSESGRPQRDSERKRNGQQSTPKPHPTDGEEEMTPLQRMDSGARSRKRRGEDQLLLDDHLLPEEMRRGAALASKRSKDVKQEEIEESEAAEAEDEDGEGGDEGRVRCVCKTEDPDIMMIQCDKCLVWQHGPCMGIWDDDEAPDEYFCDECRPDLHGPLRRYIRSLGRNPPIYLSPTPSALERLHNNHEKHPPSQSKRWKQPNQPSRARKPAVSPIESTDGKRSGRDKDKSVSAALPAVTKPPAPSKAPISTASDAKKKAEEKAKRVAIASHSPSRSPPPHSGKRRSTMNSRDAAYEEQVRAALEASRMENEDTENVIEEVEEQPPVDTVDEEEKAHRKGKRKREEEETDPSASGKPKHPNQYTYRPKTVAVVQAAASPARRVGQASTPVPTLPPPAQHEHGTRRAGAIANGIIPPPPNTISVHNLHWHLPDHLSAFSDLLPGSHPIPIEARASRTMAYLPRSHFLNAKYGPLSEDRDDKGRLVLPDDHAPRELTGDPTTQLEPPARIRYPAKRITTSEMRKRVRNLLDYTSRVQVEEARRRERASLIGIDVNRLPKATHLDKDGKPIDPFEEENRQEAVRTDKGRRSAELLDELVNDLHALQESLSGTQGGLGATPMASAISTFSSSVPVTPSLPSAATMGQDSADAQSNHEEADTVLEGKDRESHVLDHQDMKMDGLVDLEVQEEPPVSVDGDVNGVYMPRDETTAEGKTGIADIEGLAANKGETAAVTLDVYREGEVKAVIAE